MKQTFETNFVLKLLDHTGQISVVFTGGQNCNLVAETYVLLLHKGKKWGIFRCMHISGAPAHSPSLTVGFVVVVHAVRRSALKPEKDWIFIL